MLDHLGIQVADVQAAATFYDRILAPLGFARVLDFGHAIGFGPPGRPHFWLGPLPAGASGEEVHIAFAAADRDAVVAFRDAAAEAGAEILHEPRLFPEYHPTYFGAFVRDLDGNNVEAVCHDAG